jgi:uncharacterized protein YbaA (DUF1428 family)
VNCIALPRCRDSRSTRDSDLRPGAAPGASEFEREYGALEYREYVADDVQMEEITSFPRSVLAKRGETVVFAWIVFKSRGLRATVSTPR